MRYQVYEAIKLLKSGVSESEILKRRGIGHKTLADARMIVEKEAPKVVVTRHRALVEYLIEIGLVPNGTPVIEHATEDDVSGAHVIGVLPVHLAALALSYTEIPLNAPKDTRGQELNLDDVRKYAGRPRTFKVIEV